MDKTREQMKAWAAQDSNQPLGPSTRAAAQWPLERLRALGPWLRRFLTTYASRNEKAWEHYLERQARNPTRE